MTIGRALLGLVFPLDFSSAHTRFLFRLPSLYFLAKSAAMWITMLVQSQDDSVFTRIAILQPIGNWVAQKSMEDVCWYTFMATCFTLCMEKYMSAWNETSTTYINRLQKEQQ